MFYPVFLNLQGKRVVVIGGGRVAERKVASLVETGARITVVSPQVTPRLDLLGEAERIEVQKRSYVQGDCRDAALVLSATDDVEVSRAVWDEATRQGIPVNTADQPDLCDFIMPAVVRRGDLTIAVSTGGTSPALAARLRQDLSQKLGSEYAQLLDLLRRARPDIRRRVQNEDDRKTLHYRILDSDIIESLKLNDSASAERRLREIIEDFVCHRKTS